MGFESLVLLLPQIVNIDGHDFRQFDLLRIVIHFIFLFAHDQPPLVLFHALIKLSSIIRSSFWELSSSTKILVVKSCSAYFGMFFNKITVCLGES